MKETFLMFSSDKNGAAPSPLSSGKITQKIKVESRIMNSLSFLFPKSRAGASRRKTGSFIVAAPGLKIKPEPQAKGKGAPQGNGNGDGDGHGDGRGRWRELKILFKALINLFLQRVRLFLRLDSGALVKNPAPSQNDQVEASLAAAPQSSKMSRPPVSSPPLLKLLDEAGYTPEKRKTFRLALTHPGADPRGRGGYQRLEYLGDSVLGMAAASMIFRANPMMREGGMTRLRESLVSERALALLGRRLGVQGLIITAPGDSRLKHKDCLIADVLEAIVGAMLEDMGPEETLAAAEKLLALHPAWQARL